MKMETPQLPLDQVLQGDCIDLLKDFPPATVDVIFADPPYNLQLQQELWRPNTTLVEAVQDEWDHFSSFAEYDAFTYRWLKACRRVLKDTGTIWVIGTYHNIYRVGAILQNLEYWILNDVVWIKTNPMPNFRGVRLTNAHETLIWAQKQRGASYTFNYHTLKDLNDDLQMRSDWYLPICTGKERIRINGVKAHTTQKPEALLYRIIQASSRVGDIILDPFFGLGTTGAVARKLHRHWIGIEKEAGYVEIARQRLQDVHPVADPNDLGDLASDRRRKEKIPFGMLLETGLMHAGQKVYFECKPDLVAIVQADGCLRMGDQIGSIHQLGRALRGGSCNGWVSWFYQDKKTGEMTPIDSLRQQLRSRV